MNFFRSIGFGKVREGGELDRVKLKIINLDKLDSNVKILNLEYYTIYLEIILKRNLKYMVII